MKFIDADKIENTTICGQGARVGWAPWGKQNRRCGGTMVLFKCWTKALSVFATQMISADVVHTA
jgi:hypothetical protein